MNNNPLMCDSDREVTEYKVRQKSSSKNDKKQQQDVSISPATIKNSIKYVMWYIGINKKRWRSIIRRLI